MGFVSKESKASNTNKEEWASYFTSEGNLVVAGSVTATGKLVIRTTSGNDSPTVCIVEDAPVAGALDCVYAGANQATYLCSGESGYNTETARNFRRSLRRADEDIVLTADNNVVIATNCNTMKASDVRKFTVHADGHIRIQGRIYPDIEGGIWNNSPYTLRSGDIERSVAPTADKYLYIPFYGKNGIGNARDRLAVIEYRKYTNNQAQFRFGLNSPGNADSEVFAGFIAKWVQNGNSWAAQLFLSHHPSANSNDACVATTKWVNDHISAAVPTGTILPFDGTNVPSGYLVCNGAAVSRTTYAALFAVLGTRHGEGDGKTTFNLPNAHRRFLEMTTTTSEVGETVEAGLPNISGSFVAVFTGNEVSGAFSSGGTGRSKSGTDWDGQKINFSASSSSGIYGKSSSVQPTSIRCLAIIKT